MPGRRRRSFWAWHSLHQPWRQQDTPGEGLVAISVALVVTLVALAATLVALVVSEPPGQPLGRTPSTASPLLLGGASLAGGMN
jgi:hypothetical protein